LESGLPETAERKTSAANPEGRLSSSPSTASERMRTKIAAVFSAYPAASMSFSLRREMH
jgi:hypothetical protein